MVVAVVVVIVLENIAAAFVKERDTLYFLTFTNCGMLLSHCYGYMENRFGFILCGQVSKYKAKERHANGAL